MTWRRHRWLGSLALWRPSLFRRLLGVQALIGGLVWVAFCMLVWAFFQREREGIIDGDLQLRSQTLARMAQLQGQQGDLRGVVDHLVRLNLRWTLPLLGFDDVGYQLHHVEHGLQVRGGARAMPLTSVAAARELGRQTGALVPGWRAQATFSPDGQWLAVVAYREPWVERFQMWALGSGAMSFALLMLLLWAALWLSAWVGLRPLRRLTELLARRAPDDLTPLPTAGAQLELVPLVDTLNDKMSRLQILIERERAFFADAAHELRTPLAALGAQAHGLAAAQGVEERQHALQQLESGVQRCAGVLDKLLRLARLDSSPMHSPPGLVDVGALLRQWVAEQAPRAIRRGSSLAYQGPESLQAQGEAEQLDAALACLIDNAIRHTPPGSEIVISLSAQGIECRIAVTDDGPGIPPGDRERVFERFVRLQGDPEGSGLGLTLVRRVAELHGGRAWVANREQGCEVVMSWPGLRSLTAVGRDARTGD